MPSSKSSSKSSSSALVASLVVCGLLGGLGLSWHDAREGGRDWADHVAQNEAALEHAEQLAALDARLDKLREDRLGLQRKRVALLAQMIEGAEEPSQVDEIQGQLDAVDEPLAEPAKPSAVGKPGSGTRPKATAKVAPEAPREASTPARPRIDLRASDDPLEGI